jgi:hypothetical protein
MEPFAAKRRSSWPILMSLAAATGCAGLGTSVPASESPIVPRRECRSYQQLVSPAQPEAFAARSLKRVQACPEQAGRALAAELRRLRTSTDTARLEKATRLAHYLHDGELWRGALSLAGDSGASPEARVFAFRTLVWTMAPAARLSYGGMIRPWPQALLESGGSYTIHYYGGHTAHDLTWPAFGTPTPADFLSRTRAVCGRVAADPNEADLVRRAARTTCAWKPEPELLDRRARRGQN